MFANWGACKGQPVDVKGGPVRVSHLVSNDFAVDESLAEDLALLRVDHGVLDRDTGEAVPD